MSPPTYCLFRVARCSSRSDVMHITTYMHTDCCNIVLLEALKHYMTGRHDRPTWSQPIPRGLVVLSSRLLTAVKAHQISISKTPINSSRGVYSGSTGKEGTRIMWYPLCYLHVKPLFLLGMSTPGVRVEPWIESAAPVSYIRTSSTKVYQVSSKPRGARCLNQFSTDAHGLASTDVA